jgi:hypothetical protein
MIACTGNGFGPRGPGAWPRPARWIGLIALCCLVSTGLPCALGGQEVPDVFDYRFDDVDPAKIYAGPVSFDHAGHVTAHQLACSRCHHTLEPGEAAVDEHCRDCHPEAGFVRGEAAAGMDRDDLMAHYLNALHDQCIDCHKAIKIQDRQRDIPVGCTQCHDRSQLPPPR